MTQFNKQISNIAELNVVFLTLDKVSQDYALSLLQALRSAQTTYFNSAKKEAIHMEFMFEKFGKLLEQAYQSKAGLLNFLHQNADTTDPILEDDLVSAAICIEEQGMTDEQCVDFMRNHFSGDWDGFLYEVVNYIDEYVLEYSAA